MDKLEPCPFCGGEAYVVEGNYDSWEDGYAIRCSNCALTFGASGRIGETYEWMCIYKTEAEAIKAWNTRWERKCNLIPAPYREFTAGYEYKCSECGFLMTDHDSYCAECGARRV